MSRYRQVRYFLRNLRWYRVNWREAFSSAARPLFGALVFLLAFGAAAWHLNLAPDVFADEIIYTRLGVRVAGEGALVWDSGKPFYVHPPLYFLLEGAYFKLATAMAGVSLPVTHPDMIFHWVYFARDINVFLAGLTALTLFALGTRLRSLRWGLLFAGLFILDPFGVRINRRAMLETLAAFLSLAGMALQLTALRDERKQVPRAIFSGLLLGAALLTKEMTFTSPLALAIFGLWQWLRRVQKTRSRRLTPSILSPFLAALIAFASYALYPLWMLVNGNISGFASEKFLSLERLLGLVQLTGWNRPGVSMLTFIAERLEDYGPSYLLLALGGGAAVWIAIFARQTRSGRLLAVWGLLLYPFFAFVALFGAGNDQFFYFLLVPAVVLVAYAISIPPAQRAFAPLRLPIPQAIIQRSLLVLILITVFPFNLFHWLWRYNGGQDNGYYQLTMYVNANIPAGTPINASGDPIKFRYFWPQHPIVGASTSEEAQKAGTRYYVLVPKDVRARYGRITPELASWITRYGQQIFDVKYDSYGEIYLYRVDAAAAGLAPAPEVDASYERMFLPSTAQQVGFFSVSLALWIGVWSSIAIGLLLRPLSGFENASLAFSAHTRERG